MALQLKIFKNTAILQSKQNILTTPNVGHLDVKRY